MGTRLFLFSLFITASSIVSYSQVKEPRFSGDALVAKTDGSYTPIRCEQATYSLSNVLAVKGGKSSAILPTGEPLKFIVRVLGEEFERTQESWFHLFKFKISGGKRTVQIPADETLFKDIEIKCNVVRHGVSSFSLTVDELEPGEYCIWETSTFISLLNGKQEIITFSIE